jgi:hypothetical protein
MDYETARVRNTLPVPAGQYGGSPGGTYDYFDEVALNPPAGAESATIDLLYQPTSWEYIQFLYLGNDGQNAFLGEEGINMLDAWLNTGMAEPHVMASTTWGAPPGGCEAPAPNLLSVTPGDSHVIAEWEEIPASSVTIDGYRLFYDQANKAQLVADLPWTEELDSHDDQGLTNGQEYCYKVTSYIGVDENGEFETTGYRARRDGAVTGQRGDSHCRRGPGGRDGGHGIQRSRSRPGDQPGSGGWHTGAKGLRG